MDLQRALLTLFLFFFATLIQALPIQALSKQKYEHESELNLGIAFIHGTKDHRLDAYGIYWKLDFIQSVSQALANPENHYVVHCDFSQYMWHADAALCTADQLLEFINEKKI